MSIADKLITIADNTPAVVDAVKASKATVQGIAIRVDDVLNTGHTLEISAAGVTDVYVYGKNLLPTNSVTAGADNNKVLYEGMITGDFVFSCVFNYEDCKAPNAAQFRFTYTDNAGASKTASLIYGNLANRSIAFSGTLTKIEYLNWGQAQNGTVDNLQLEVGTIATEYEAYKGVQTGTADEHGKVAGLKSVAPTMTVVIDDAEEGTVKYFPTSAATIYENYQQLVQAETDLKAIL